MDRISGTNFSDLGLIPIRYNGILDMPARLGDISIDWGDFLQPLVFDDDINWRSKAFNLDLVFDKRVGGSSIQNTISYLLSLSEVLLETKYGSYTVKVKQVNKVVDHDVIIGLTVFFTELNPLFNAELHAAIGGNTFNIDGYDLLNDFGILIEKLYPIDYIPELRRSSKTVFETSRDFSEFRNFKKFELDCVASFNTVSELNATTDKFKKLLSSPGYRIITLNNQKYNTFFSEGLKVVFINESTIKFKLKLNITARFSERGLFANGFIN